MNSMVEILNNAGGIFVKNSLGMLIQSSALILALLLIDFLIRKKVRAVVRYFLWMLVLVKLMLPTTFALPTGLGYWMGGGFLTPEIAQTQPPKTPPAVAISTEPSLPAIQTQAVAAHTRQRQMAHNAPVGRFYRPNLPGYPGERLRYQLAEPSSFMPPAQTQEPLPSPVAKTSETKTPAPVIQVVSTDISWQAMVLLGYLSVAAALTLLLIQRIMFVRSLVRQSTLASDDLQILLSECRHSRGLNIKRKVEIRLSTSSASPAICGLLKPVILIPEFLPDKLDRQQLKAVLLHELIHLKRGDLWVNMIQTILQIINFYNPLLWVANAIIRRIREQAVDETVLVTMGRESEDYPQALLDVAGLALSRPALSLRLVGVVESKSELAGRIKHMMTTPLPKSAKLGLAGAAMLITFAALLLPMAGAAQKPAKEKPKIKSEKSIAHNPSYDPVVESYIKQSGKNCFIDFDKGKLVNSPKSGFKYGTESAIKWTEENGIDAGGGAQPEIKGLIGFDMIIFPVGQDGWQKWTPETLSANKDNIFKSSKPGNPVYISGKGELPATYLFKTREGNVGILQILESKKYSYTKIRYKMLKAPSSDKTILDSPEKESKISTKFLPNKKIVNVVENFFVHNGRDITSRKTIKWGQPEKLPNGNTKIRYTFEAIIWEKEKKLIVMDFIISPDNKVIDAKKIEMKDLGKITTISVSRKKQVLAAIEALKADVVKLSKKYPQLAGAKDIPVTPEGWTFRHDYRDMGKAGYENTGSFPVGIGLRIMPTSEFNKKVHSMQMRMPHPRWKGLDMVGWIELHTGNNIPSELTSSLQQATHNALAKIGKLNRQEFEARLPENIKQQRTAILTKASTDIYSGIHKLAEQFPQLKKTMHWNNFATPKGPVNRISIYLRRLHGGKGGTDNQAIPEDQKISILIVVKPQPDEIQQLMMSDLYPNLGLVGQVHAGAGDPKLNAALKKLVNDALAPLAKLNAQAAAGNATPQSVAIQNARPTPKTGTIVINPALPWNTSHWAGNINTDAASLATKDDRSVFTVGQADRRHVWTYYIANRFSPQEYPIAVLTYRAKDTSKSGSYVLWLDDTTGPNSGGIVVFKSDQLIDDGKVHELRQDMRKLNPDGDIIGMALGVRCGSKAPAEFELIGLRFEPENPTGDLEQPVKLENDKPIKLQVVDENDVPISGAEIASDMEQKHLTRRAKTDSKGMATIVPVKTPTGKHMLNISAPNKIPVAVGKATQKEPIVFPEKVILPTAVRYSGIVQDKNGKPIKGASVSVLATGNRQKNVRYNSLNGTVTDADGKWQTPLMPKCEQPWVRLAHPDYISNNYYDSKAPVAKLLDGTAVFLMEKGAVLTGSVIGPDGKPIQGAQVKQGQDRHGSHFPDARTDAEGKFAFKQVQPGEEVIITVQKGGFAPTMERINFGPNTKPVCIQLKKGNTIRGKIVDKSGQPVEGARISADTWRGCRAISWGKTVGKDGKFEWNDAPADMVEFDIYKRDYMSNRRFAMSPSENEYTVTLLKPIKVSGNVVDAETGKAIPHFNVVLGIKWDDKRAVYWQRRGNRVDYGKDGKYAVMFDEPRYGHLIRIEADDYEPADSRTIKDGEGNIVINFKLKKGTPIKGVVYGPDGKPVDNAQLNFVIPGTSAYIRNGSFHRQDNPEYTTKNDGEYNFGVQTGKWKIVAIHPSGYAELTNHEYEKNPDIKLKPWGKVKGKLMVGSKPCAGGQVNINMLEKYDRSIKPRVYHELTTMADKAGNYELDRVPPGEFSIGRYIKIGTRRWSTQQAQKGEIKPGETLTINIGGKGRPVKGKVTLPEAAKKEVHWQYSMSHISTKQPTMPKPKLPDNWDKMDQKEKGEWYKQWQQSDAGKAHKAKMQAMFQERKYFNFAVQPDGSFYIDDVPTGTYQLRINAYEPPKGSCGYGDCIGLIDNYEFTIPPMPNGRMDEPFDIGSHELILRQRLKLGSPAPSFEVKTLDGKTIRLSDFRGKYVLLDFWATWCGPCRGETPHLKAVYDKYGKDSRFAIIGLSLDSKMEDAKQYVEKNGLKWTQGFLGEWAKTKLPASYDVNGIPAIFFIGPDGKVIAKKLRGNAIMQEVSKYLGQNSKVAPAPTSKPAAKANALENVTPFVKKLSQQDVEPHVWILHDNDPDFRTAPFEDTLVLHGKSKKVGLKLSGFNICETVGAHRMLTHSKFDDTIIICENVADNILKYDRKGKLIFGKKCKAEAADVLSDGTIFVLVSAGTIYGDEILKFSPKGKLLGRNKIGGFDLAVDEKNKGIYVVGSSIKYVGFDLNEKWKIDPIEWCAVSVDVCSDGSAWIAERKHPDLPTSKNCLIHVSPKGKILQKVVLDYSPLCLRVDRRNDNVYVAGGELYKYDSKGKKIFNVWTDFDRNYCLDLDRDGNIWIGTRTDVKQFSPKGELLQNVKGFSKKHQKYIACCK